MILYFPPNVTAGFATPEVKTPRRLPCPPAKSMAIISFLITSFTSRHMLSFLVYKIIPHKYYFVHHFAQYFDYLKNIFNKLHNIFTRFFIFDEFFYQLCEFLRYFPFHSPISFDLQGFSFANFAYMVIIRK